MSLRSVRTLDRKLREHEARVTPEVAEAMVRWGEEFTAQLPRFPSITTAMREVLEESLEDVLSLGSYWVVRAQREGRIALERDLKAVLSSISSPPLTTDEILEGMDTADAAVVAVDFLRGRLEPIWQFIESEAIRQGHLARLYEDDWKARLTSPAPLQVIGRRGMGVWPGSISVVVVHMLSAVYGLVMVERVRAAEVLSA